MSRYHPASPALVLCLVLVLGACQQQEYRESAHGGDVELTRSGLDVSAPAEQIDDVVPGPGAVRFEVAGKDKDQDGGPG